MIWQVFLRFRFTKYSKMSQVIFRHEVNSLHGRAGWKVPWFACHVYHEVLDYLEPNIFQSQCTRMVRGHLLDSRLCPVM